MCWAAPRHECVLCEWMRSRVAEKNHATSFPTFTFVFPVIHLSRRSFCSLNVFIAGTHGALFVELYFIRLYIRKVYDYWSCIYRDGTVWISYSCNVVCKSEFLQWKQAVHSPALDVYQRQECQCLGGNVLDNYNLMLPVFFLYSCMLWTQTPLWVGVCVYFGAWSGP